jgi:anti-sigma regulatory factor (Ser/Thr protein kinase)
MFVRAVHRIPGGPAAAAQARELVARELSDQLPASTAEDARLLVSELATNSVIHGGADENETITLEIAADDVIRIEVGDEGPGFGLAPPGNNGAARLPAATSRASSSRAWLAHRLAPFGGYGLLLVEQIADRWGIECSPHGTRVWFELDPESSYSSPN